MVNNQQIKDLLNCHSCFCMKTLLLVTFFYQHHAKSEKVIAKFNIKIVKQFVIGPC